MSQPRVIQGPWVGTIAILFVILMGTGMFYYQFYVLPAQVGAPHVPQNLTIEITAEQWAFMINGTIDSRNTPVVVHVGDNVTFHVHATFLRDPSFNQHGFFIQGIMEVPVVVAAGHDITINLVPTQAGEYTIICTVFCGTGHSDMHGLLTVLP